MLDLSRETTLSLSQAAQRCPGAPNVSTVWRWALRGVQLDSYVRGGRRYTTVEALDRFISATTAVAAERIGDTDPTPVTTGSRRREVAAADAYCRAHGI